MATVKNVCCRCNQALCIDNYKDDKIVYVNVSKGYYNEYRKDVYVRVGHGSKTAQVFHVECWNRIVNGLNIGLYKDKGKDDDKRPTRKSRVEEVPEVVQDRPF